VTLPLCCVKCHLLRFTKELDLIIVKFTTEMGDRINDQRVCVDDFCQDLVTPFLKLLVRILEDKSIPVSESPFKCLFLRLSSNYIVRYVDSEPEKSKDWKRDPVECECKNCRELNESLVNLVEITRRFIRKTKARNTSNVLYPMTMTLLSMKIIVLWSSQKTKDQYGKAGLQRVAERGNSTSQDLVELPGELLRDILAGMYGIMDSSCLSKLMNWPPYCRILKIGVYHPLFCQNLKTLASTQFLQHERVSYLIISDSLASI
jgi:hypothetical protein